MTIILACAVCSCDLGAAQAEEKVDFDREVRPILVANCYKCHGPHDEARKAGLRFDSYQGATATLRKGHRAIVPFSADES